MALSDDTKKLAELLFKLQQELQAETMEKFQRVNPFNEDLFDWKQRGIDWLKEDRNVTIYNSTTLNGKVDIGSDTWIGPFCSLNGGEAGLTIGRNCSISASCHILTHDTVKWALSMGKHPYENAPVSIGDGCFIGTASVITRGVSLGERCLVAAGSVVTKSFPPFSIVAGVPAKKIGKVCVDADSVNFEYCSS